MSQQLTLVAKLRAKPGMESRVREVFGALRTPTHTEDGCVYYEFHQSIENPREFLFYENWTSAAHLDVHLKTPHVQAAFKAIPEILDGPIELTKWTMLS